MNTITSERVRHVLEALRGLPAGVPANDRHGGFARCDGPALFHPFHLGADLPPRLPLPEVRYEKRRVDP